MVANRGEKHGTAERRLTIEIVGADGGSRTHTALPPQDFKSCVSTSSTTSAALLARFATAIACQAKVARQPVARDHGQPQRSGSGDRDRLAVPVGDVQRRGQVGVTLQQRP